MQGLLGLVFLGLSLSFSNGKRGGIRGLLGLGDYSIDYVLDAVRRSYRMALEKAGQPRPTDKQIRAAIYIDHAGRWGKPRGSAIVINYEEGVVPSPRDDYGFQIQESAQEFMQQIVGEDFYFEELNGAIAIVESEAKSGWRGSDVYKSL